MCASPLSRGTAGRGEGSAAGRWSDAESLDSQIHEPCPVLHRQPRLQHGSTGHLLPWMPQVATTGVCAGYG